MVIDEIVKREVDLFFKDGCIIELMDEWNFMNGKVHLFVSGIRYALDDHIPNASIILLFLHIIFFPIQILKIGTELQIC